jgi:hypothetical protein
MTGEYKGIDVNTYLSSLIQTAQIKACVLNSYRAKIIICILFNE